MASPEVAQACRNLGVDKNVIWNRQKD